MVTVVAINAIWNTEENKKEELEEKERVKLVTNNNTKVEEDSLEKRLENILANIDGVR